MKRSESIAALAAALSATQGEMRHALKDSTGQIGQQKTKYADLASCWEACREPLSKNGISVAQTPSADGVKVTITTLLMHKSGEWIESELTMVSTQNTPQAIGSCITYARRYSLASIVGISPEDDDGTAASQGGGKPEARPQSQPRQPAPAKPEPKPDLGVSEKDIPPAFQKRQLPPTMLSSYERLQKNLGNFASVCERIQALMIDRFGKAGDDAYLAVCDAFVAKFPKGNVTLADLREVLIDLHEVGERLESEK